MRVPTIFMALKHERNKKVFLKPEPADAAFQGGHFAATQRSLSRSGAALSRFYCFNFFKFH